jgi:hypothetical protein
MELFVVLLHHVFLVIFLLKKNIIKFMFYKKDKHYQLMMADKVNLFLYNKLFAFQFPLKFKNEIFYLILFAV